MSFNIVNNNVTKSDLAYDISNINAGMIFIPFTANCLATGLTACINTQQGGYVIFNAQDIVFFTFAVANIVGGDPSKTIIIGPALSQAGALTRTLISNTGTNFLGATSNGTNTIINVPITGLYLTTNLSDVALTSASINGNMLVWRRSLQS